METYLLGFIDSIPRDYLAYLFLIALLASIVAIAACALSFPLLKCLKMQKITIEKVQTSLDCEKKQTKTLMTSAKAS